MTPMEPVIDFTEPKVGFEASQSSKYLLDKQVNGQLKAKPPLAMGINVILNRRFMSFGSFVVVNCKAQAFTSPALSLCH